MVSTDHFRQELQAQMGRAAKGGLIDVLINSAELSRSLGGDASPNSKMSSCCDAMQEEIRPGDTVLINRDSGPGMTVRYRLPRIVGIQIGLPFKSN